MALNCGGRPPDPAQKVPGYLLIKKGSEMAEVESSQQAVATTTMFGSSHNMHTGSASCGYVGSKSNDDYKGVSCVGGYGSYACSNNIIGTKMGADDYYRHHEPPVQLHMGFGHRQQLQGSVGEEVHEQQVQAAGRGYAHPTCGSAQIGSTAAQLRSVGASDHHHRSHHDMELMSSALQLQGKSAGSQLLAGANNCGSSKELPQPAPGTDHPLTYYDMSMKMTVQQRQLDVDAPDHHRSLLGDSSGRITAVEAAVRHTLGEGDHHHNEREGNTAAARVPQLQYMKLSPEGSSMEEQEGVYYGGSTGGAGGNMQMNAWGQYNMQEQEGQSMMMMMKKRRLTNEQVKSLEVSFERESKLEAERKKELAQELGLQPRQVAVWFQNRRARFKTKQLERDFDLLKHQYNAVRSEKDKLLAEVAKLKGLLDAQTAASEGKLLTPANDTQRKDNMDEDKKVHHLSPESPETQKDTEGTRNQKATAEAGTGKQKATSNQKHSENSDQTHVHAAMDQASKHFSKGSFTLEVKPSLQVPHVDHYYYHQPQQQQQFPNTLSPPTKLSLCSPQQLFLHHMVAMKMEGDTFNLAQHEPRNSNLYNDHHNFHHNQDEEDESMLCFNSTWHHDP